MEDEDHDDNESLLSRFEKQRSLLKEAEEPPQLSAEEEELLEKSDDEIEKNLGGLTTAEKNEKKKLEEQGFGLWTRKHFQLYIKAMETFGRKDIENIALHVDDKDPAEVKRYHAVFWKKYKQIKGWDKHLTAITKGEEWQARVMSIQQTINKKVQSYSNPFEMLKIEYSSQQKVYTEEEDRFIICMLAQLGYGNWSELQREIRQAWEFRFDWFLKSRTTQELAKRTEYLLKQIEEEETSTKSKGKKKKKQLKRFPR